jgi:hypothetical protein
MMLTFNLLGGNTKYLFENVDQYCLWYLKHDQSSSTAETSKLKRFLKLIALSHPLTKDLILSYLLDPSSLTDRLSLSEQLKRLFAFDDIDSFQINPLTVPLLSVHQLQGLSSETLASSAKHLTKHL